MKKKRKWGAPLRRGQSRRLALMSGLHNFKKVEKKKRRNERREKNKKWGKRGRAANGRGCESRVEGWRSFSGGK